jgi:Spy/CpxP family protein refolding chaperone
MFKTIGRAVFLIVACAVLAAAPEVIAQVATQPSAGGGQSNGGRMRPGPAIIIARYKHAVSQLDLTDDQRMEIDAFFNQANQQGMDLSQKLADADPSDRYQMLGDFVKQLHSQLANLLSDGQLAQLDKNIGPLLTGRRAGQFGGGGGAATQPAAGAGAGAGRNNFGGPGGGIIQAMQQALAKVDLSDDQKQEVQELLKDAGAQVAALRQKAQGGANIQQDLAQVRQQVRDKLQTILTDDQMQQFVQQMQQLRQNRGPRGGGGGGGGGATADVKSPKPDDLNFNGPEVGSAVPDVQITEANGRSFTPAKYKGHVLVIEFGSMSCPVFREHAAAMEKLKTAEQGRAFFLIVYTKEAFPAGDKNAERNKEEGVAVPDAASLDDRKAQALETQRELRITIPMAVDNMGDSISKTFGGFPNGAVVIGKDGAVAAYQQWTNPDTLREAIDDAVSASQVAENR